MESSFLTILYAKYIVFSFVNVTFIEYLHKVQDMSRSCPFSLIQKPGANLKFGLLLLPIRELVFQMGSFGEIKYNLY